MDYAILTYQYADNPKGIPSVWPAEIVRLGDHSVPNDPPPPDLPDPDLRWPKFKTITISFPPDNRIGWIQMSDSDYATYLSANQSAYNTWELTQINPSGGGLPEN